MTKKDIIRKLTSRKFWMAVALFVSGILVATGHTQDESKMVYGLIMQGAAVVAYILGEGLTDSKHVGEYEEYEEDDAVE